MKNMQDYKVVIDKLVDAGFDTQEKLMKFIDIVAEHKGNMPMIAELGIEILDN